MEEKVIKKIGYYLVTESVGKNKRKQKYKVDSGKTIFLAKAGKTIKNPYRDVKYFESVDSATVYVKKKLTKRNKEKSKKLKKLPKSLYLVLIREKITNTLFVKVGFTTKKYIYRRFSNKHGYEGYTVESILRRVKTSKAEILEDRIKKQLNKKRSVKKYRPVLESFSGYSECYDHMCLTDVLKIFDSIAVCSK